MRTIRIAAAQFEHHSGDKQANLDTIHALTRQAVEQDAEIVSFHECCVSGYTFVQSLTKDALLDLAEPLADSPSVRQLHEISREFGVPVLAGLFERDGDEIFNTYVCVHEGQLVARYRKIHAFVSPYLSPGSEYVVFDLLGCKCGILICYDNNLGENVRMNALLGAEVVFMPHVTGCLPSAMPGRGLVEPRLWHNRERDPVPLRQEFAGPKGREWLLRWLPTRAYENGIYTVFTNPIGMDADQVRNGNSMIFDPYGEIIAECKELGNDVAVATCIPEKIKLSSGQRYLRARRPELYGKLVEPPAEPPVTKPGWELKHNTADAAPE